MESLNLPRSAIPQKVMVCSKLTRSNQVPRGTVAELVKDTVSVCLLHFGMNVVARVSKFGNFLGQQFDSVNRVAKDDTLIDLKLGKKCVETVDLLSLFDVGVKLGDTTKGKFVHEVNTVWAGDELLAERFDRDREGSAKETDLVVLVTKVDNLFQDGLELGREKLIGFVHDDSFDVAQIGNLFGRKIKNTSRGGNNDVDRVVETHDIVLKGSSSGGDHTLHSHVLSHFSDNCGCLEGQFSCGDQDQN